MFPVLAVHENICPCGYRRRLATRIARFNGDFAVQVNKLMNAPASMDSWLPFPQHPRRRTRAAHPAARGKLASPQQVLNRSAPTAVVFPA
jgi:hypothetical protein